MTILVTGASGHLGRLIVERLLARGAAASDIVAGARTPAKVADLGVRAVELDYDRPETVAAAVEGVDRVVLVSSSEVGKRLEQHRAVVDAAAAAGVELLVYTSLFRATESPLPLAPEHVATEQLIAEAGVPAAILRNDWYTENYAGNVAQARETGEVTASAGDGRVSSASRVDYADAAAVVALGDGHAGKVYELAGDTAWSFDELAATIAEIVGREVVYRRLTTEEHIAALEAAGLDAGTAGFVAALDAGIAAGALEASDRTLSELIGRPTTPLAEGLRAAL
ncbi:NmrA family NAD(P)-binding protein [Microbacterium sp. SORGH_AS_0888]|uniref:NAD(P)H-binding protein n=1 Tax=Microbacterium sp. SORGH_AS_0888 TaxID=3041791 RepID=UPI0027831952|nr:NmrA family NAD(P)-binding protein [Microbacterium sp. SORGH_AS_0888]MDQ1129958.1 NAD(P)H dehydrogenase (quinone) [Microbacterium sp. SORGH_AS_0888]